MSKDKSNARRCLDFSGPPWDTTATLPEKWGASRPSCELLWVLPEANGDDEGGVPVLALQLLNAAPMAQALKSIGFYYRAGGRFRKLWVGRNTTNNAATWREVAAIVNAARDDGRRYKVRLTERPLPFPPLPFAVLEDGSLRFLEKSSQAAADYPDGKLADDRSRAKWTDTERGVLEGILARRKAGDPFFPHNIEDERNRGLAVVLLETFFKLAKVRRSKDGIAAELRRIAENPTIANQVICDARIGAYWLTRIADDERGASPDRPIKPRVVVPALQPAAVVSTVQPAKPNLPDPPAPLPDVGAFLEAFGGDLEAARRALAREAARKLREQADALEVES